MKKLKIIFLIIILTSCTCSIKDIMKTLDIKKPTAHIEKTKITGLSLKDLDLMFYIQINNPNVIGIELHTFDYDLEIDGRSFISGRQDHGLKIPAQGKNTIQIPVNMIFEDIFNTFQYLSTEDSTKYRLACNLYFNLPVLGIVKLPVEKSGRMPVIKMPVLSVNHIRVKRLDLLGSDLELNLKVKNPNAFIININGFNCQFDVAGNTWIQTTKADKIHIPIKGSSNLIIPITLNFIQVGQSVFQLLSGGSDLNYRLKGDLNLNTSHELIKKEIMKFDEAGNVSILR